MRRILLAVVLLAELALPACGRSGEALAADGTGFVPLVDMGQQTYLGFEGGLYEGGSNDVPADHAVTGTVRAGQMQPLDAAGSPSDGGNIVLLSVGMSNTTQEFCSASSAPPCDSFTFMGQAAASAQVNHTTLVIVNGAAGGQAATTWDSPLDANYDRVRDTRLAPAGVTEQQVQAVWVKVANPGPTSSLPAVNADAYALEASMGGIVRALRARYPNVKLVFLSSRIYGGYATTTLNPEPYAYESGFSVKWLIQAQIDQMRNGGVPVDPRAGDLDYNTVAPWITWGPYLWADGLTPRSDGLTWLPSDFSADGTHPATGGREKVGTMLLDFFLTSPYTECWFSVACAGDTDGDGFDDASDNCPSAPNPDQLNSDSMALDGESPPNSGIIAAGADATNPHADVQGDACDADDDNDGLMDAGEAAGCNASGALSTTDLDSDSDLFPDGYECAQATNPAASTSRPPYPAASGDSDGDGLPNSVEIMVLTAGGAQNFDGDACSDARENASVNGDSLVTSADLSAVAQRFGPYRDVVTGAVVEARQVYDFNRDGTIAASDLGAVAQRFGGC